jgi:hypothetical protein
VDHPELCPHQQGLIPNGDGAMGFWKALKKVYHNTRWQRCWPLTTTKEKAQKHFLWFGGHKRLLQPIPNRAN